MAKKSSHVFGLVFLLIGLIVLGTSACKSKEENVSDENKIVLEEGKINFEGTVKTAVGKYIFIPEYRGFDFVIQGNLESGISDLIGKEVKGIAEYSKDQNSIIFVNTLDVKDESGNSNNIFNRQEEVILEDFVSIVDREGYEILENLNYRENKGWEGKEKAKIFGKLVGEEGSYKISLSDDNDKEIGIILVENITDYASYYKKKLRLFDKFWFYLNVKDTVAWNTRRRTKELFKADVLFCGLF